MNESIYFETGSIPTVKINAAITASKASEIIDGLSLPPVISLSFPRKIYLQVLFSLKTQTVLFRTQVKLSFCQPALRQVLVMLSKCDPDYNYSTESPRNSSLSLLFAFLFSFVNDECGKSFFCKGASFVFELITYSFPETLFKSLLPVHYNISCLLFNCLIAVVICLSH